MQLYIIDYYNKNFSGVTTYVKQLSEAYRRHPFIKWNKISKIKEIDSVVVKREKSYNGLIDYCIIDIKVNINYRGTQFEIVPLSGYPGVSKIKSKGLDKE